MTSTQRPSRPVQVHVSSRTVAVRLYGHKIDGWPAAIAIAIIMIVKLTVTILKLAWFLLALVAPPVFRFTIRQAAGLYLAFRAFYTH